MGQRQGQKQDYRVPSDVKAELIQQFAVNVITSGRTSGSAISAELKEHCNNPIPARTVRYHLARMGLGKIKGSLPQLVSAVKKLHELFLDMKHRLPFLPEPLNSSLIRPLIGGEGLGNEPPSQL